MVITAFPPLTDVDESGLVAIGGDLEVESLLLAYRSGIFPWPILENEELTWFCPAERAILRFDKFHVPKSLRKIAKRGRYVFRFNAACEQVIEYCARSPNRGLEEGTWITNDIIEAYSRLHRAGYCHSVECYENEELIGGLYGVSIGGMFAGESLFYLRPNSSKLSLWVLVEHLREKGVNWIDCQQMTTLLSAFGAEVVSRDEFLEMLGEAVSRDVTLFEPGEPPLMKK